MTMQFDGRLKFILNGAGADPELYDLQNDPREITNLARQPSYQEQVKELTAQLVAWRDQDQVEAEATQRGRQEQPGRTDRPRRERNPLVAALDANGDGEISAEEMANASAVLRTLDKNRDGKLTSEELRPAGRGPGGPGGRRGPRRRGGDTQRPERASRPGAEADQ